MGESDVINQFLYNDWDEHSGRLEQIKDGSTSDATELMNLSYSYDLAGNIMSIVDGKMGPQTQSFTYDEMDRLTSAEASGGQEGNYNESYTYNSSTGNLASKGGVSYTYGSQSSSCQDGSLNFAHAVVDTGSNSYCYDENGNMTERNVGSTYSLAYDAENRLVSVSGAASVDIVYDGDGQRVKVDDIVFIGEYYVYSIYGSTNYYLVNGKQIAYGSSTLPKQHTYYFLADHLNSTMVNVTEDRSYIGKEGYKAWGETRYGNLGHRFNGKQYQWNVGGLYYYGARYYDPALGRFTQADSIVPEGVQGSQAWDRYAYVNNNPLRYTDPSGHVLDPGGDEGGGIWSPFLKSEKEREESYQTSTSTPETLYKPVPTSTPTPETLIRPGPTSTPEFSIGEYPGQIYHIKYPWLDLSRLSDKDKIGAIIDLIGLGGSICAFIPGVGAVPYVVSEVVEGVGITYNVIDLVFFYEPHGFILDLTEIGVDVGSIIPEPITGAIFNIIGLGVTTKDGWYIKDSIIHIP